MERVRGAVKSNKSLSVFNGLEKRFLPFLGHWLAAVGGLRRGQVLGRIKKKCVERRDVLGREHRSIFGAYQLPMVLLADRPQNRLRIAWLTVLDLDHRVLKASRSMEKQ